MMFDTIRAQSVLLVALIPTAILQLRGCSANLEIHQSPTSQVIVLGDSATFNCSASDGTFELSINGSPIRHSRSIPERGITAVIDEVYNQNSDEVDFTASVTIEGTRANNNTELRCSVISYSSSIRSDTATLTVIGPPDPLSMLAIPEQLLDLETMMFSVVWVIPYSNSDHPILQYTVKITNPRTAESYERIISPAALVITLDNATNITLDFPPNTSSCDMLLITVTAVSDIGDSNPASANISIPEVPKSGPSVSTSVLFQNDGTPIITLKMKFPKLCSFERLTYTVFLRNRTQNKYQEFLMLQKSVTNPPESVTETIASGLVANTNYSIVVLAWTEVWNTSTTPYNFSTQFTPGVSSTLTGDLSTITPSVEAASPRSASISSLVLGIIAGTAAVLILLIAIVVTLLLVVCCRKRRAGFSTSIEELKTESVPYDLTPNPIYDGPLYDTVQESIKSTLKSQPHPPPARTEPVYSESPTENKRRNVAVSDYEEFTLCQKDTEECYILMQSYKQQ